MANFAYKFIVLLLTFFLVFNTASIAHAHTYEANNNVIKLDSENSFFTNSEMKFIIAQDEINTNSLEKNKDGLDITAQIFTSAFFTTLVSLLLPMSSLAIVGSVFSAKNANISLNIMSYLMPILYPFINSGIVYALGLNKNKHSYPMTLLGSTLFTLIYASLIIVIVLVDSYMMLGLDKTPFQELGVLFVLPIFVSAGATIFYQMSEEKSTPNEPIKTSMSSEELINKIKNDFSFAEKIKVKNGAISLKIAVF